MIWDCLDFSVVHNKVLEVPFSLSKFDINNLRIFNSYMEINKKK